MQADLKEAVDDELEKIHESIVTCLQLRIDQEREKKTSADDAGTFGEYRFAEGKIAGLQHAIGCVDDWFTWLHKL